MHLRPRRVAFGVLVCVLALIASACAANNTSIPGAQVVDDADDQAASNEGPSASEVVELTQVELPPVTTPVEGPLSPVPGIVVTPGHPDPQTDVDIAVEVSADTATLTYKVDFDDPVTVDMAIADGIASATVPGQDAASLVRYRIDTDTTSLPHEDDTIEFLGYVVRDPEETSPIPRIDWFMDPAVFDDMIQNHLLDNEMFPATVAYAGLVYDNVMVRPRGGDYRRTNFPKQSFEFEFPKGHDFIAPALFPYPVDQFAMGSQFGDWTMGREFASWSIFNGETGRPVNSAQVYLAQNGYFYGVYRISEKLDGEWREAVGLDGGGFYKANGLGGWNHLDGWEVKRPKEGTADAINEMGVRLRSDPAGPAKTTFLYENFDIPNVINYMALSALIEHDDQTFQNFFVFHDADHSGLYSVHPWDLDETFGPKILCWEVPMTDPVCLQNPLFNSIMEVPEFEAMYWQRMRTLVDKYLAPGLLEDRHATLLDHVGADLADQEATQWGRNSAFAMTDVFNWGIQERRDAFANEPRLLPAQPSQPEITFGEILADPAEGKAEVLELRNETDAPVDLSGWTIEGVDLVIPGGTVIPAGGSVLLTDSLKTLRSTLSDKNSVVIEYGGGLKADGETLTLSKANGDIIVELAY